MASLVGCGKVGELDVRAGVLGVFFCWIPFLILVSSFYFLGKKYRGLSHEEDKVQGWRVRSSFSVFFFFFQNFQMMMMSRGSVSSPVHEVKRQKISEY